MLTTRWDGQQELFFIGKICPAEAGLYSARHGPLVL
jgi:hypothetical protein